MGRPATVLAVFRGLPRQIARPGSGTKIIVILRRADAVWQVGEAGCVDHLDASVSGMPRRHRK
jgi:hypothetical protein